MCKRLVFLICFVLVLGAPGRASGGLVAHWAFDEGAGTTARDSSGNNYHGNIVGNADWISEGIVGGALHFDGSTYVVVDDNIGEFETFSVALWFKYDSFIVNWNSIWHNNGWTGGWLHHMVTNYAGQDVRVQFAVNGAGDQFGVTPIQTGVWYHSTVTYDSTTGQMNFYLTTDDERQANLDAAITVSGPAVTITAGQIGGWEGGRLSSATFDDLRMYDRILSAAQIEGLVNGIPPTWVKAEAPDPPDGATGVTAPLLSWTPGTTAAFHDVYLGTNPTPGAAEYKGRQPLAWAMWFEMGGWVSGTTYYWRIDEVEADGTTIHTGDVWSFSALGHKAFNPDPPDGTEGVWLEDVELSWDAGKDASSHDVYLGSDETEVTNGTGGTFKGNQTDLFYNPATLEVETTYYWRIDEHEGGNVHTGDVWKFKTIERGPGGAIYRWWSGFGGVAVSDLTSHAGFPDNPTGSQLVPDFEGLLNWADNYGAQMYGWLYPPGTGSYTFWLATDDGGELWLSTDEDPANRVLIASVEGWVPSRNWDGTAGIPGTNQRSSPVALEAGKRYYIEGLMKEAGGGDNISAAWQGPGIPTRELITGAYVAPTPHAPVRAATPNPADGAVNIVDTPTLEWVPGAFATQHDVYFGTDAAAVAAADTTTPGIYRTRQASTSYAPGTLEWGKTYYWKVNELNLPDIWEGEVWSFTVAEFIGIDDFEPYDDYCNRIFYTWEEGGGYNPNMECGILPSNGNGTGSLGGYAVAPYAEQTIVHDGLQSMPMEYLNDGSTGKALYSETERTFETPQDWTRHNVKALSLWFRGLPGSVGSFNYDPGTDIYTMTADGADIWNDSDEFHYAYKRLSGVGTVEAQVLSVQNTNGWAKAGVMIRETLDANSVNVMAAATPGNGVSFQWRPTIGGASDFTNQTGITAPHWVRLTRSGNIFTAEHSADGSVWDTLGTAMSVPMAADVYVGLAVTSHNDDPTVACEATFSDVTITGTVTGQWLSQDIGITSNVAEQLYVAVEDSTGTSEVAEHPDPNAVQLGTWQEWNIDLADFSPVDITKVKKMYIGVGDRNAPKLGGAGMLYVDDIRLYQPRCIPSLLKPDADFNGNCVVDYSDLEIMANEWLADANDLQADLDLDNHVDFKDYAGLTDTWLHELLWP